MRSKSQFNDELVSKSELRGALFEPLNCAVFEGRATKRNRQGVTLSWRNSLI